MAFPRYLDSNLYTIHWEAPGRDGLREDPHAVSQTRSGSNFRLFLT